MNLNSVFQVRAFPIFVTLILFLLSIMSQGRLLRQVREWDIKNVFWYSMALSVVLIYVINETIETDLFSGTTTGWNIMIMMMFLISLGYVLSFYQLSAVYKSVERDYRRSAFVGAIMFMLPFISFLYLDQKSKFSSKGISLISLSSAGLFVMLFNADDFIDKKSPRTILSIILSLVLLLGYLASWYIHFEENHKLVFVLWIITAILMILSKEDIITQTGRRAIISDKHLPRDVLFAIIASLSVLSTLGMYFYPVKTNFDSYQDIILMSSAVTGAAISWFRQTKRRGYGEFLWIWLLSFVNVTVIDGYIKFAQTSKILTHEEGLLTNSIVNVPVFVNAFMAFYTTYRGINKTSKSGTDTRNVEEIGFWTMMFLTFVTYVSAAFSLLFNAGDLREKVFEEVLYKINKGAI